MNNLLTSKSFRPMYIFTVLAILLILNLWTVTHSDLKVELETVLNTSIGGILALLGTVVNYEFGSAKPRDMATRAGENGGAVETTTVQTVKTSTGEEKP